MRATQLVPQILGPPYPYSGPTGPKRSHKQHAIPAMTSPRSPFTLCAATQRPVFGPRSEHPVPLVLSACHCCPSLLRVPAPHACSPKAQLPWAIGNVGRLEGFVDPVYRPIVGSAPPCITTLRTYELAGNSDPTHSTPWVAPSRLLLILHRQRGDPVWARSSLRLLHHVIIKVQCCHFNNAPD